MIASLMSSPLLTLNPFVRLCKLHWSISLPTGTFTLRLCLVILRVKLPRLIVPVLYHKASHARLLTTEVLSRLAWKGMTRAKVR